MTLTRVELTDEQYAAEFERQALALHEHVKAMAVEGQLNIDVLSAAFAAVLSYYVGQLPPERISIVLEHFDQILDEGIDEFLVPPGVVVQ